MICPICGALNNDNVQLCCACGSNMYTQPQGQYQQPNYQQPNYQQPNYQQPNYQQPNYQQGYYQQSPYYPQPEKKDPGKVLGIVGFALAMGSLVLSDGVILAIAGIIVSAIGFKKSKEAGFKNGFAKGGLIAGIIFTSITIVLLALFIIFYIMVIFLEMGPSSL